MAQYNGYVSVPHGSYDEWRGATIGNGYNVDYYAGDQCWDFCALLYWQYNLTLVTGNGTAEGCWSIARAINSQPPFEAVMGKMNIKRGDILVFGPTPFNYAGHICFADENYNGTDTISCLGQNQRGNGSGYPATVDNQNLAYFYGIFRNTNWTDSPTPPTPSEDKAKKRKFPWAVATNHWYNGKRK